jgi:feruloyl esterase
MAINRAMNSSAAGVLPPAKYPLLHDAVLRACDARDGVKDGVLENPATCRFDPLSLQCAGAGSDENSCLTPAQVATARVMYRGAVHPTSRATVLPGLAVGTELEWKIIGDVAPINYAVDAFRYVFFQDASWDPLRYDARRDLDLALAADPNDVLGPIDANLGGFFARGGKLLLYHGWSDPQVSPYNTISFFHEIVAANGGAGTGTSVQLYMLPGVGHCTGGPGPDTFDQMAAIEQWLSTGSAPDRIEAAHSSDGVVDRTRPLCPFGKVAHWNGKGSSDDAANFTCVAASLGEEPGR